MNKIAQQYHSIFNSKIDGIGLAVFRIAFGLVLFFEMIQLYTYRNIMFDKDAFVYMGEINVSYLLYFWTIAVVLIILGLFTRLAVIVNYIFAVIVFSAATKFEYHVFFVYSCICFLMLFLPLSRVLSLDSLIEKVKYSGIGKPYSPDRTILEINNLALVFGAVGLVYFDSVFHKFSAHLWLDGLGVWLPSSLPMVAWHDTTPLLNQEWLVKSLGYLVLAFEAVFIFLFWFRKLRVPLLLIGILFHIGIWISYPIPLFAATYIAVYLLLVPASFWLRISRAMKLKSPVYAFYYDAECPLCAKVVVVIRHIDIFGAIKCTTVQGNYENDAALRSIDEETLLINIHGVTKSGKVFVGYWAYVQLFKSLIYTYPVGLLLSLPGISLIGKKIYAYIAGDRLTVRCTEENCTLPVFHYPTPETQDVMVKGWNKLALTKIFWKFLLTFMLLAQCLVIWFSPVVQNHLPYKEKFNAIMSVPYEKLDVFLEDFIGIRYHAVFVDRHFKNFNHIIGVNYQDENGKNHLVPIFDRRGMPSTYNVAILWRNVAFEINTANIRTEKIEQPIIPYLRYYLRKNQIAGSKHTFNFYIKEIEVPTEWRYNFLKDQIAKPWKKVGSCVLKNNTATYTWNAEMLRILEQERHEK